MHESRGLGDVYKRQMHAIVWKIRVILLQIFVWIVDLKVREHLTEYLKKDIKYHRVTTGVHV